MHRDDVRVWVWLWDAPLMKMIGLSQESKVAVLIPGIYVEISYCEEEPYCFGGHQRSSEVTGVESHNPP